MSKRVRTCGRGDPARELHERAGVLERDRGLLAQLADRRRAVGVVALALARVDRAAREHPDAAHEPRLGRALDEQHFERLRATAQQDHRRRLACAGAGLAGVELLARAGVTIAVELLAGLSVVAEGRIAHRQRPYGR